MPSMLRPFDSYQTYFFDCDGVLLDSNRVKSEAFYQAVLGYGETLATLFLEYHKSHGGISRQEKFAYFFREILGLEVLPEAEYENVLEEYARQVKVGLEQCALAPGVEHALGQLPEGVKCFVVSGGAEDEVRWALRLKGIDKKFCGIYGNPEDKLQLVARAGRDCPWTAPVLFLGDAKYDHIVASHYNMDFLFVAGLSEFMQWPDYAEQHDLSVVQTLAEL